MVNIYKLFGKVLFNHKWSLASFTRQRLDHGHENIYNTYLFYQVCKLHDIAVLETSSSMQRSYDTLVSDISA